VPRLDELRRQPRFQDVDARSGEAVSQGR
jgi:hypothetical protein